MRVTPRASRDQIKSLERGEKGEIQIRVSVTAPPVEGEANAHLVKFLADLLGIRKNQVALKRGETNRQKIFMISGLDEEIMLKKIREAIKK